jgi:hypothetical protein
MVSKLKTTNTTSISLAFQKVEVKDYQKAFLLQKVRHYIFLMELMYVSGITDFSRKRKESLQPPTENT